MPRTTTKTEVTALPVVPTTPTKPVVVIKKDKTTKVLTVSQTDAAIAAKLNVIISVAQEQLDAIINPVKEYVKKNELSSLPIGTAAQCKFYAGSTTTSLDENALRVMLAQLTIVDDKGEVRHMTKEEIEGKILESKTSKTKSSSVRLYWSDNAALVNDMTNKINEITK